MKGKRDTVTQNEMILIGYSKNKSASANTISANN